MDKRREQLLKLVIDSYVKTAEPIGSKFLVAKGLKWSEATVRNELRALEKEGYLSHPHTSAGRVPTEKGYRHYLQLLDLEKNQTENSPLGRGRGGLAKEMKKLEKAANTTPKDEQKDRALARSLAKLSTEAVIFASSPENVFYTGLANLFSQPEFNSSEMAVDMSAMFDRCEDCMDEFFAMVEDEPKFFLAGEHPFGDELGVLAVRFGEDQESLLALLGPLRMDYAFNLALFKKTMELFG